ncbi:MAG TPA: SulP family inorganic anion transporter [Accumulibacter sp.]|nr:SulP family inorganic anion transporter [Accumulibacter sp.]
MQPHWLATCRADTFVGDLIAGLIVTVLVIPQSLAYAMLAGLPAEVGLYASILPVAAYALVGSSMTQAVGPVAIIAMMTASVLGPLAVPGSSTYQGLASSLSLLSGGLLLAGGVLRLGFLAQLLSCPVMAAFLAGSAILIILGQVKYLFGLPSSMSGMWPVLSVWRQLTDIHLPTALIALVTLLLLTLGRRAVVWSLARVGVGAISAGFAVRLLPVTVVGCWTLAVIVFDLDRSHGVAVIGQVVEGLPSLLFFIPTLETVQILLVPAATLALVGMVQNVTMAQALAIKRHEPFSANAELFGLGLANIVTAFHGGMPVGGGLSRSAVNEAAGARTPLAGVVSAVAMALVAVGAAHWFSRVPLAVLAANIIVGAWRMIDLRTFRRAWAYDRADGIAYLGTAIGVLVVGPATGIGLGIVLSMGTLLLRASTPHIAVIGRVPGTEHFRNIERHRVETLPQVIFMRIDESLFFGNLGPVELRLKQTLAASPAVRHLVLAMGAVNRLDATAVEVLGEINRDLSARQIRLHLAEVKGPVQDRLVNTAFWETLSGEVFLSTNAAFEQLRQAR